MRTRLSLAAGLIASSVLTHGFFIAGRDLWRLYPLFSYRVLFQRAIVQMGAWWCAVHGSTGPGLFNGQACDIDDFGRFLADFCRFAFPVIGFVLFWLGSRHPVGRRVWKPPAIAVLFAGRPYVLLWAPLRMTGLPEEWCEVGRASAVLLLMVWSVGAFRRPLPPPVRVDLRPAVTP